MSKNLLSFDLQRTADWRERLAKRRRNDWRLGLAAKRLRELAESAAEDAEAERRYDALREDEKISINALSEIHSEVLGDIGFRWDPPTVDDVFRRIVELASAA
jgi:hypothetical protein